MDKLRAILLICFLNIPSFIISLLMPVLSKMDHYFAISFREAALGVWVVLVGYLVGQLLYIPLSRRYNPVISLRVGLVLIIVAYAVLKLATAIKTFWLFDCGEFVVGLGIASSFCCGYAILNSYFSHSRVKKLLPYSNFAFATFSSIATLISSYFSQQGMWKNSINFIFLFAAIALLATLAFKMTNKPTTKQTTSPSTKRTMNYKVFLIYALSLGMGGYLGYGYSVAMPHLSVHVLHISLSTYGVYTVWMVPLAIPGFFLSYYALNKLGARKTVIYSVFATILAVILLYALRFIPHRIVIPVFAAVGLMTLTSTSLFPASAFLASNASPNKQYAASLMGVVNIAGILIGLLIQDLLPFAPFNSFLLVLFVFLVLIFILSLVESKGGHAYN